MKIWLTTVLLLTTPAMAGCGAPEEEPCEDMEFVGPIEDSAVEPAPIQKNDPHEERLDQILVDSSRAINQVDALRCFLLHEREIREGRAPGEWVQPPLDKYESSDDPCALLPGFIDPNMVERLELEQQRLQVQEGEKVGKLAPSLR